MVVTKRKKVGKYRGHTTHGGGHRKKRRGAGSRGGRGNAGTGKRAGHKKAGMTCTLGKKGFGIGGARPKKVKSINLGRFTAEKLTTWLNQGRIIMEGEIYILDLKQLGYGKLLGTGNAALKLKIKVDSCSKSAAEKIKVAGGEVITKDSGLKKKK